MKNRFLLAFLLFFSAAFSQKIGDWKLHFRYENSIDIVDAGDKVYSATEKAIMIYDKEDGSLRLLDKAKGLTDIDPVAIDYCAQTNTVIIAYANSNIDLIKGNTIINVPDIKNKITASSKTIRDIYTDSTIAYISSDLGIILLDTENEEIDNTYVIGDDGNPVSVFDCTIVEDSIFAVTSQGLKKAYLREENLLDFESWTHNVPTPNNAPIDFIESFNDSLFVAIDSMIFVADNGVWTNIFSQDSSTIESLTASENLCFTVYKRDNNNDFISTASLEKNGSSFDSIITPETSRPSVVSKDNNDFYVADFSSGLLKYNNGNREWLLPSGQPYGNTAYRMSSHGNQVFVSAGGFNEGLNFQSITDGFYIYEDNTWSNVNKFVGDYLQDVQDISSIKLNPVDEKVYMGSANGLIEYDFNTTVQYDYKNTILDTLSYDSLTVVLGIDFDENGNTWMINSQVANPLVVKTREGEWYEFDINNAIKKYNKLYIDSYGQKWITLAGEGIYVFDEGESIENTTDDITINLGGGSLHNKNVHAIVEDKNNEIWVGTDEGIAVFDCPRDILDASSGCRISRQIKSTLDEYTEYLFETDIVNAIAVDGANRKWIGTTSGVWLMSESGEEEILRFNIDNSPMPSNFVTDIAINGETGEVFIGTDAGLVSYESDATEGAETHNNVKVFPNPVRPEYQGFISVIGLVEGAFVKITDVNGNLIDEGFALGGKYIWDGKDYSGRKAKTGVYYIFSSNSDGSEKAVAKVSFVN